MYHLPYPQSAFADCLSNDIEEFPLTHAHIIDAPCGKGEIAYALANHLSPRYPDLVIEASDISAELIDYAKKRYFSPSLSYSQSDILATLQSQQTLSTLCIINSLYLLPDPHTLLSHISSKMNSLSRLYLILPNVETRSYLRYQQKNSTKNVLSLTPAEYSSFFGKYHLQVTRCIPCAFAPPYLPLVSGAYTLHKRYLRSIANLVSSLLSLFPFMTPHYYLVVLTVSSSGIQEKARDCDLCPPE